MLNNKSPYYQLWVNLLRSNPPKAQGKLESPENPEARCCLGHLCHVSIPELRRTHYTGDVYYGGCVAVLPASLCLELNIKCEGNLTERGIRIVMLFLRENNIPFLGASIYPISLARVNDNTPADHAFIGELIEHLVWCEQTLDIECFWNWKENQ